MPWSDLVVYGAVLAVAGACGLAARAMRLPPAAVALVAGLVVGPVGLELVAPSTVQRALPGVVLHVALLLGVLGYRLGHGMLRLPALEIVRRSLPPLALAAVALAVGALVLPLLLPDAEPERPFFRFALPLAFVFAVLTLLALRDLRERAPADVGSLFLVAVGMVGAVSSFTPALLWSRVSAGVIWRQPVLVLGESGALGVGAALLWLLLVRRLRLPRVPVTVAILLGAAHWAFVLDLWPPFTALGFGIVLGRTGASPWRWPHRGLYSEAPFALLVAAVFAPDLFLEALWGPSLLHVAALAGLLLLVRAKARDGRSLVTGPGLLFLGLTLTVRLDGRMAPVTRYAVDFALPAWVGLRVLMAAISRRARSRPTSTPRTD